MSSSAGQKAEALNESVSFAYDGETYAIPPTSEWDLDVLVSYENGKIAATVEGLLGADQWKTFRSKKRTVGDLNGLFEELQKAVGVSGN